MDAKSTLLLRGLILGVILFYCINIAVSQSGGNALFLQNENYLNHGDFVYFGAKDYGFTNKLTVACWVKWTVNPNTYSNNHNENEGKWANLITIDRHNTKDNGQFWLQHSSSNANFEWSVQANTRKYIYSTTAPSKDVWVYLVGVYNGSVTGKTMIFYVNGIEEAHLNNTDINGNISSFNSLLRFNIGRLPNGYRLFPGLIDEIRIWKRALEADEIRKQMFNKNTVSNIDLVSFWNMNAGTGTDILDATTNHVDGKFYSALVDVHSYTVSPYTISDSDKTWEVNSWQLCPIKTVAGDGVDEINIVTSNNVTTLLLQNAWITTPKLDDYGTGTGMTWYGIEKSGEGSQWVNSTAPIGEDCKLVKIQDSTSIGWSGASLSTKISSTLDDNNNLSVYFWGNVDGLPVTGESFPSGITRRSNMVWGIREWGSVTSSIFISFPNITTSFRAGSAVLLGRVSGTNTWIQITAVRDSTARSFYAPNATSFYEYAIGMTEEVMPVKLESFSFTTSSNSVSLIWKTTEEINNSGFDIERSQNGSEFKKTGFIKGYGNSSGKIYTFLDNSLNSGEYKYRLKQIDYNGNYEYFNLNSSVLISAPVKFSLDQNYPNPANPTSNIDYHIPVNSFVNIEVYDASGRMVTRLINEEVEAGYHTIKFDGSKLSSGVYYYRIFSKSKKEEYIKSKKMILLK